MQVITLYCYEREGNGITVSPYKPDCEYTEAFRLIADEGKILVKENIMTKCVDVDDSEGWNEIDHVENSEAVTE